MKPGYQNRYLITHRLTTTTGTFEKSQMWDPRKAKRLDLPHFSSLELMDGKVSIKYKRDVLHSLDLQDFERLSSFTNLGPGHEMSVSAIQPLTPAHQDLIQTQSDMIPSSSSSFFCYAGSGTSLHSFQELGEKNSFPIFSIHSESNELSIHLTKSDESLILYKNGVPFKSLTQTSDTIHLSLELLPLVELRHLQNWWKFSYFSPPILMDESAYETLDVQEGKQDFMFRSLLASGIVVAAMAVFTFSVFTYFGERTAKPIVAQTEIHVDSNLLKEVELSAKPIVFEAPKPEPAKKEEETPLPEVAESKPQAKEESLHPTPPGQMLNRHAEMLQDAFKSILALNHAPTGQQPGSPKANSPKGFLNGANQPAQPKLATSLASGFPSSQSNPNQYISDQQPAKLLGAGKSTGSGEGAGYAKSNASILLTTQTLANASRGLTLNAASSGINQGMIVAVFQKHVSEIRNCYESALIDRPELHGTVTLTFLIGAKGNVMNSSIRDSSVRNMNRSVANEGHNLESCLLNRLNTWGFPKPNDGKPVEILSYPLVFKSLGGASE